MLIKYIKQKHKTIIAFLIFVSMFALTFYLYKIPLKAVEYPLILCVFIGLLFLIADYIFELKKYRTLNLIKKSGVNIIESLPLPDTVSAGQYQEIIALLISSNQSAENIASKRYDDMINYYTLWAHQIKTPIASMRLTLQNDDSDISRRLQNDLCRIENYVNMVLSYLRLDSNQTDYLIEKCELDKIVKETVKKFSGEFISKKLSFSFENTNALILTDEKWISFVIEQLISNAVKYTEKGGVTVNFSNNRLYIKDTGIGITASDIPRIFENGFTGFNGRKDKKASGIGLYLCKRTCDNLGHKIGIEKSDENGTTVYIDFTVKKEFTE